MNEKLARYQRLDLLADSIISETFKFRGTTYVPASFPSSQFGRFVVGIGGDVIPLDSCDIYQHVLRYLRANKPFGTWIENGNIYFDYVTFFNNLDEALQCAKENSQIAIYDIMNDECIYVT